MLGNALVASVLVVFALIISFSALKWFTEPYLWIFLAWASVFLCALRLIPRAKTMWVSLAVLACSLAGLEGFFWVSEHWIFKDVRSEGTFAWVSDDVLGFAAPKGVARTEAKYYRGEKLYDVVYTMDANGLRISSPHPHGAKASLGCVLFFGDAYTFGWGLNDQETMPYRVAVRSGEKYHVYNLAFLTHGAHQMLVALDHGLVNKEVDCASRDVKYVIYSATPDQVRKAAGLREIDHQHGPRYVLGADGSVSYQGQFGEDRSIAEKINSRLVKSSLYRKLVGGDAIYYRRYNDADVALYLAIVNASSVRMKSLYPDAEFHVLVWGNDALDLDRSGELSRKLLSELKDKGKGFVVHRINDILPGADEDKPEYFMGKFSLHPNAAADDRIADYIVHNILKHSG
jgi:hypothetical protein